MHHMYTEFYYLISNLNIHLYIRQYFHIGFIVHIMCLCSQLTFSYLQFIVQIFHIIVDISINLNSTAW